LDCDPPKFAFHYLGLQKDNIMPGLLVEMRWGLRNFLPRMALNNNPLDPDICLLSSLIMGICHNLQPYVDSFHLLFYIYNLQGNI
jgi:hypothetical protein